MKQLPIGLQAGLILAMLGHTSCIFAQRTLAITGATIETAGDAGTIECGTLLISDGKIKAIGKDVSIPVSAQVIDAAGKTILPGFVDPYFVVPISRASQAAATRTVVFGGRTFVIGGGPPPIATDFARVADGFDAAKVDWAPALRSGITSYHLVTSGYGQSMLAQRDAENVNIFTPDGWLHLTATNSTQTLDVLRNGLKGSNSRGGSPRGRPTAEQLAALRGRGGRPPASGTSPPASVRTPPSSGASNPTTALWTAVKEGKSPLFVNVNNASAILHVDAIVKETPKANIAMVASGEDIYLTMEELKSKGYSLVLAPDIDLIPNTRNRINVPQMLNDEQLDFSFSLSLGQSDFRAQQNTPLFAVAILIRSGLDRQVAIKALTLQPAKLLEIDTEVGSLEVGKKANLILFDGDPFAVTTGIDQVFVEGKPIHAN